MDPLGDPGVKSRMCLPYPHACRKGRLKWGAVIYIAQVADTALSTNLTETWRAITGACRTNIVANRKNPITSYEGPSVCNKRTSGGCADHSSTSQQKRCGNTKAIIMTLYSFRSTLNQVKRSNFADLSLWRFYLTAHTVCTGMLFLWIFNSKGGTTFI